MIVTCEKCNTMWGSHVEGGNCPTCGTTHARFARPAHVEEEAARSAEVMAREAEATAQANAPAVFVSKLKPAKTYTCSCGYVALTIEELQAHSHLPEAA